MSASLFTNLPAELRLLKQWVLWRYEDIGAAKPTKVPYSIKGHPASVTNPDHWSTFDIIHNISGYDGLGFVFTKDCPYTFIDLDDAEGDDAILQRHLKVYHEFETYAEVSPSGKGLHLICKGKVPAGRRRSKIEIYPHERYATMTGNVYNNRNIIIDCQSQLTQLWEQMGSGPVAQSLYQGDDKEYESDEVIIEKATLAVNGDKFLRLHNGDWQDFYNSQSEADFAYIDIIAFYTQNRIQISRIFRKSALGKRDKAKRNDYVSGMISRSFDRMLPPLDFDGLKNSIETKLSEVKETKHLNGNVAQLVEPAAHNSIGAGSSPAVPTTPPGLLGDIATFIYQAAPRPVPEVALAAAISLMAGICGRAYNISGTGLNQYVLLLAMTGAGKEAAASGINKLMGTIKMQVPTSSGFIGPSEISSGPALFKYLGNQSQSFVSLLGEFGLRLQAMSAPGANGSEVSLRRMFLELYNKSGYSDMLQSSVYSKKEDNTSAVASPSFSILGESTPERFYGALTEDMISEGLLPRFMIIEYKGERPPNNENHASVIPNFSLVERLASLAAQCETVNHSNPRRVINVQSTPEASKMLHDFDKYADARINKSNKEVIRQLWNRAHLKVLKLAALIAVGENMISPIINTDNFNWAVHMIESDIKALTERFEAGEIGGNSFEIKQANEIIRMIKEYHKSPYENLAKYMPPKSEILYSDKIVPYAYLSKRLIAIAAFRTDRMGATFAIKRAIQSLIDSDRIKEVGKVWCNEKYGTSQKCYVLSDLSVLD